MKDQPKVFVTIEKEYYEELLENQKPQLPRQWFNAIIRILKGMPNGKTSSPELGEFLERHRDKWDADPSSIDQCVD